jgi:hypothetical protein
MSPVDFGKLNGKSMDEIKRPPSAPASTYYGVIKAYKFADTRFANKETNQPDGAIVLEISPTECADPSVELPPGYTLRGKVFSHETAIIDCNGNSLPGQYYTKVLMEALGIPTAGRSLPEAAPDLIGAQVMFDLTARPDKNNPEVIYNDVRKLRAKAA